MKSGSGKRKGSEYERVIAKFLSKWITGNDKDLLFWRSPSSGSLCTISNIKEASGDLIAIKPEGEWFLNIFNVEIKTGYPKADFFQFFKDVKNDIIKDFWIQCQKDAKKADKTGILIFKKNGLKAIVGICPMTKYVLEKKVKLPRCLEVNYDDIIPVCFYDMEEFFKIVTPQIIKMIGEKI
jgi:hypothetical protein